MEPWLIMVPENESSTPLLNSNESDFAIHNVSTDKEVVGWSAARMQRVITLSIFMLMSLVGNSVIIFILFCSRYHKQLNRVNIFIINLAIGDLAVCCITMSSELIFEVFQEWKLGNAGCKIIMYTQVVTLSSTTYILMAMSWDRYKAICCPLDFNPSPSKARKVVAAAWLTALIFAIPNFFIYIQVEDLNADGTTVFYCHSAGYTANWQKKLNFIWLTCSVLIFPALWIAYCYFSVARVVWQQGNCQKMASIDGFTLLRKTCDIRVIPRAKIKTMKMSLTIVITFVVCWTPYFVVYNIRIFSDYKLSIPDSLMVLADTLALMNSAVNPIIYGCFNLRIRQGLQEACCFNINVHSDKSRLSEPSGSTSSTVRFKSIRRENTSNGRTKRKPPNGDTGFEFAQSTRHIQNKRSQTLQRLQAQEGSRDHNRTLINPFRSSTQRRSPHLNDNAFTASIHELQAQPTKSEENGVKSTTT